MPKYRNMSGGASRRTTYFPCGDFGDSRYVILRRAISCAAPAMCQNLPTNMVVSPMNVNVEMARAELCPKQILWTHTQKLRSYPACASPIIHPVTASHGNALITMLNNRKVLRLLGAHYLS